MTDTATRAAEANRAQAALDEFLTPAFDVVIASYLQRMTEIAGKEPWEAKKITSLASAVKIAEAVRGQIRAIVSDGDVARVDMKRAQQIEDMPTEKRRLFGYAPV
jgi:hypothetical protein